MDLTPDTVADASLEDQLRYWQQQRAKVGGVKEVRTRDKTVVYDATWIAKEIERLEDEVRRRNRGSRVVYGYHGRR